MNEQIENKRLELIGRFFAFLVATITAVFVCLECYKSNERNIKKMEMKNSNLLAKRFKVKEIFTTQRGSKPANYYTVHECIVEDMDSKERLLVEFDGQTIPLVDDIWSVQIDGYCNGNHRYVLNSKISKD